MPDASTGHIMGGVSAKEQFYIRATCIPLNIISLIASVIVLLAYTAARIYSAELIDRVSLRLTIGLTVADLLFAIFQIIGFSHVQANTALCAASVWGYVASSLLATFLTVCLAFNLHVVFVSGARNTHSYERWYFVFSILASLLISLAPFIGHRYGFDEKEQTCWFKDVESGIGLLWAWLTLYLWVILGILYCTLAVSVILLHLHRGKRKMQHRQIVGIPSEQDTLDSPPPASTRETKRHSIQGRRKNIPSLPPSTNAIVLNRIVTRLVMYPVVLIIAQVLNVAVEMSTFGSGSYNFPLYLASFIATSSQGLLNALVFLVDPAVRTCWRCVRRDLITNYGLNYNPSQSPPRHPWVAASLHWWVRVWLVREDEEVGQDPSPPRHPSPAKHSSPRPGMNALGKGGTGRVNPTTASFRSSRSARRDGQGRMERVPGRILHPVPSNRRAFPVSPGPSRHLRADREQDKREMMNRPGQGEEGQWYGSPSPLPKALVRDQTHDTRAQDGHGHPYSPPSTRTSSPIERRNTSEARWSEGTRIQSKGSNPSTGNQDKGKMKEESEESMGMTGQIVILDEESQESFSPGSMEEGRTRSGSAERHRLAMALI
ncbi:MAG: hypothetical protein DHS80DRAFT_22571 [Piptocephalis tieghemiana]|nr:MAG: hypothetical protein DHS80DRAFT_22571 [Piptocephalis tieghemiana]